MTIFTAVNGTKIIRHVGTSGFPVIPYTMGLNFEAIFKGIRFSYTFAKKVQQLFKYFIIYK